jgi:hypothetical protein
MNFLVYLKLSISHLSLQGEGYLKQKPSSKTGLAPPFFELLFHWTKQSFEQEAFYPFPFWFSPSFVSDDKRRTLIDLSLICEEQTECQQTVLTYEIL